MINMNINDVNRIYGKQCTINSKNKRLTVKLITEIISLHEDGLTVTEIHKKTRVLRESIRYYIKIKGNS